MSKDTVPGLRAKQAEMLLRIEEIQGTVTVVERDYERLRGALEELVRWHEEAVHDPELLWAAFARGRRALDGIDEGPLG